MRHFVVKKEGLPPLSYAVAPCGFAGFFVFCVDCFGCWLPLFCPVPLGAGVAVVCGFVPVGWVDDGVLSCADCLAVVSAVVALGCVNCPVVSAVQFVAFLAMKSAIAAMPCLLAI